MSQATRNVDEAGAGALPDDPPRRGMVATSHPLAVDAALDVLRDGGNAVDAAVCAAAVLGVVEPMSTGLGGDCFALCWRPGDEVPLGINGSGRAPAAASVEALRAAGHDAIPEEGPFTVTVPGALRAWQDLVEARGTRSLSDLLSPAIRLAEEGFEVAPRIGEGWAQLAPALRGGAGARVWLVDGERAPRPGDAFRAPDLARSMATIASDGVDAFYDGPLAEAIAASVAGLGGWLSRADLAAHRSTWVEPLEVSYRGHPVFELPPNGQGLVVLEALGLLEGFPLGDVAEEERQHLMIEAVKLAFADARAQIGDPDHLAVDPWSLLDEDWLEQRRAAIGDRAAADPQPGAVGSDTVYVAVVDPDGGCCSLINSLYMPFGSRIVPEGTGLTLQNRGALFTLEPGHPNVLAPGRRPYHTIIPAMVFREGRPWLVLGVVGGFQQPQGQVQLLSRLVDLGEDPVPALAAPRFRWVDGARIRLEEGTPPELVAALRGRGHEIVEEAGYGGFGGAQVIRIDPVSGELSGAADPRRDGVARTMTRES